MYTNGSFDMVNTLSWKLLCKFTVIPLRILTGMFVEHEKQIPKVLLKKSKRRKILLGYGQAYSTPATRTRPS